MKTMNKNFLITFALATAFSAAQAMENQEKPTQSNSVSTQAEASAHKATDITPAGKNLDDALFAAVASKDLQQCQQLLAAKASPNKEHVVKHGPSLTCLHKAVCAGSTDICRVLISAKAQINVKRKSPYIHLAALWKQVDIAKLLLASGADATEKDYNDVTAIYAYVNSFTKHEGNDFYTLLIDYGADETETYEMNPDITIASIKKIIAERAQYHLANAHILRTGLLPEILLFIAVNALAHIVIDYAIPANLADVIYDNKFEAALRHKELYGASESLAQTSPSTSPADNETKKD